MRLEELLFSGDVLIVEYEGYTSGEQNRSQGRNCIAKVHAEVITERAFVQTFLLSPSHRFYST